MNIRFENLKKSIAERIFPVYLIEGEDSFFRARAVELIKQAILKEPDFNLTRYEGERLKGNADALVMDLRSIPFMSDYRVVEVSDWQPNATEIKGEIKNYLQSPCAESVLIVVNKGKCESLKKFECVCVVDCAKADMPVIIKYIRYKATKANLIIADSTARMIIEYSLFDMAKIDKEIDKLIDYSSGEVEITPSAVEKIVTKDADYKIYEIVGFIAKKNYAKVYEVLNEVTTPAEKQQIFASLYYHFRRLFYASVFKGDVKTLAQYLGEKEYTMRMAKEQAAFFSPTRLVGIVEKLAAYDGDFKSGRITAESAYELAVFFVLSGDRA